MRHFRLLHNELPVDPILAELDQHPQLWGEHPERIAVPGSPHAQSQDIWLRFRRQEELREPADYGAPHFAEFYPAWHALPSLHEPVFEVMRAVKATYLGGILITRIPAGGRILPHVDTGWHPEFMNVKAYVILKANPRCVNYCGDEAVIMHPGESWIFRNDITHGVDNNGDGERIAVVITMRTK